MHLDTMYLMDYLKDYSSPKSKISTMIKSGQLTRIKRGIYVKGEDYDKRVLANVIYGSSYISFEYALAFYGMIPEIAKVITSAVFNKNKNKVYDTPVGKFVYRYINPSVYFYGITRNEDYIEPFLIATKEKALCDTLYKIKKPDPKIDIERLLFEDLRIDEDSLLSLNKKDIVFLSKFYGKILINEFSKYLLKRYK